MYVIPHISNRILDFFWELHTYESAGNMAKKDFDGDRILFRRQTLCWIIFEVVELDF